MNQLPWSGKEILVLGCGNILFGDDGFGPAVAENLESKYSVPGNVMVMNAGLSVRKILFDVVLSEIAPKKIVIIDLLDHDLKPGEVVEMGIDNLRQCRMDDFSMHQIPSSNLLRELQYYKNVEISVIGACAADIPSEVRPGLSPVIKKAVNTATKLIYNKYLNPQRSINGKT